MFILILQIFTNAPEIISYSLLKKGWGGLKGLHTLSRGRQRAMEVGQVTLLGKQPDGSPAGTRDRAAQAEELQSQ